MTSAAAHGSSSKQHGASRDSHRGGRSGSNKKSRKQGLGHGGPSGNLHQGSSSRYSNNPSTREDYPGSGYQQNRRAVDNSMIS